MPAAPSSLTDPAVGQLITAAHALGIGPPRCCRYWPPSRTGGALRGASPAGSDLGRPGCAALVGARSFTGIAEWAADADPGNPGGAQGHWRGAVRVHVPADLAEPRC